MQPLGGDMRSMLPSYLVIYWLYRKRSTFASRCPGASVLWCRSP